MKKTTDQKWAFIVNPIAGNAYGEQILPQLEEKIKEYGIPGEIVLTEKNGHASELARDFAERGYTHIIAVGGDGTMNEVAKELIGRNGIITGIVPAGTGNDFIQILGYPDRFEEKHWEIFFKQNLIMMDYGTCNGTPFFNGMGLGFDAEVAARNYVAPGQTKMGSKSKYLKDILSILFFFKEYLVKIKNNGVLEETNCFINTIANGRRHGGGFFLTPHAIANDGLLDVCMVKKIGLLKRVDMLLKVTKGAHTTDRRVHYYTTARFEADFGREVPYHVDGEVFYSRYFDVQIHPKKIQVIYNPEGKHYFTI